MTDYRTTDPKDLRDAAKHQRYVSIEEMLITSLGQYGAQCAVVPANILILDSVRGNEKRPPKLTIAAPDGVVKALRSLDYRDRPLLVLVEIPAEVVNEISSLIARPDSSVLPS